MEEFIEAVNWSRAQFALTAMYHWLFVPLTLGLSFIMAVIETQYFRTNDEFYKKTAQFWGKIFAVNFAMGVATGLILEFQFGTNWSNYSYFVGDIFGAPLAIEGMFAFFIESTFVAVLFFGWDRVSKGFHLTATWMVFFGAALSAVWILIANAWMQYPVGLTFNPETARNEMISFIDLIFSPVAINKIAHTYISSLVLGSIVVIGISALYLLKNRHVKFARYSIKIASIVGLSASILTIWTGDRSARIVAEIQPMKFAAMENIRIGSENMSLCIVPGIEIPGLTSFLTHGDFDAFVVGREDIKYGNEKYGVMSFEQKRQRGLHAIEMFDNYRSALEQKDTSQMKMYRDLFNNNTFQKEYYSYFGYGFLNDANQTEPNVKLVFWAFRLMVGLGMVFIIVFLIWLIKPPKAKWWLYFSVAMMPLVYIASQSGWVVTELGRQPWAIQNLMPVTVAASKMSTASVMTTFWIFVVLFTGLLIAEISIMINQIKKGPDLEEV